MTKVIVYVDGGMVVGARSSEDADFVDVEVFDFDYKKGEEGLSTKEAQSQADATFKVYPYEIF
jgi:hypothetical protein